MSAQAEAEVALTFFREVEAVGIFENAIIMIGRAETDEKSTLGRDGCSVNLDVANGSARQRLCRRFHSKHFLNGPGNELGVVDQHLALVRVRP